MARIENGDVVCKEKQVTFINDPQAIGPTRDSSLTISSDIQDAYCKLNCLECCKVKSGNLEEVKGKIRAVHKLLIRRRQT